MSRPKTNAQRKAKQRKAATSRRQSDTRVLIPVADQPCELRFTFDSEADRDVFVNLIRPILRDHGYGVG